MLKEPHQYTLKNVEQGLMISDAMEVQHFQFQMILKLINGKKKMKVHRLHNVLSTALTVVEDGIIFALDVSEECINHGKPYFERANVSHKIKPMIGKAADSLEQLIAEEHSGTFDFFYIDADKVNYDLYYEKSLILLRAGGIVKGLVYKISQSNRINKIFLDDATSPRDLTKKLHKDRIDISFFKIGDDAVFYRKL